MKVWIDQDLCTGDGLCVEIEPALFEMHDDGLAYVREAHWPDHVLRSDGQKGDPEYQGPTGLATIPEPKLEATIEAAEECPGECIFIEVQE